LRETADVKYVDRRKRSEWWYQKAGGEDNLGVGDEKRDMENLLEEGTDR
jgi:hypothetical protein